MASGRDRNRHSKQSRNVRLDGSDATAKMAAYQSFGNISFATTRTTGTDQGG